MKSSKTAEIRYSTKGVRPSIDVSVPFGTSLADTFKLHEFLSRDLIAKLSPRGCDSCNSGVDIFIHEHFDDVIQINLESLEIMH